MTAPFTPCACPEASLLREILDGQVPAVDTPAWRALAALVEAAAARRALEIIRGTSLDVHTGTDWRAVAANPSHAELIRRRYPPHGDVACWVSGGCGQCREAA